MQRRPWDEQELKCQTGEGQPRACHCAHGADWVPCYSRWYWQVGKGGGDESKNMRDSFEDERRFMTRDLVGRDDVVPESRFPAK